MFDAILVPTDGSDCAEAAVAYAEDLATRCEATVHVLSVLDSRTLENAPQQDALEADRAELTAETCEDISGPAVATERAVATGVPHSQILSYTSEHDVDLIVMGTHGRTGVDRYLLGSVTETVVRLSDVPVLTVKERPDREVAFPYADVLVPTDGSEGAGVAVPPALDLAVTYGARVHALSVVDTMALGVDVRSGELVDSLEDAARVAVESIESQAERASIPVETAVRHGTPHREIREYVDEYGVDLVVMGTHGRSGIERYLLGSVTEKTVRTSPVPVMTVRRPE